MLVSHIAQRADGVTSGYMSQAFANPANCKDVTFTCVPGEKAQGSRLRGGDRLMYMYTVCILFLFVRMHILNRVIWQNLVSFKALVVLHIVGLTKPPSTVRSNGKGTDGQALRCRVTVDTCDAAERD